MRRILPEANSAILVIAFASFVLGITLPMFSLHKFVVLEDSFSLLGGLWHLLTQGNAALALIIFLFSVVTPLYKLLVCWLISTGRVRCPDRKLRLVNRLMLIGKWSMADVFIIAIMAATIKFGGLASVQVHVGLLFFAISVVLSMFVVQRILSRYELRPISGKP